MKTKILLWSVVSILILGLAAGAYWWLSRPQVIMFSDDAKVTLLKVEYGKRHAPPTAKTSHAAGAQARAARRGGSFTTHQRHAGALGAAAIRRQRQSISQFPVLPV